MSTPRSTNRAMAAQVAKAPIAARFVPSTRPNARRSPAAAAADSAGNAATAKDSPIRLTGMLW